MSYYTPVAEAKLASGMRLVTTAAVPGPWGESAKSIMHVKGIPVVNVAQSGGQPNPELEAWTGVNNAPVALWQDERPKTGWVEILMLAERIAPSPPLIPESEQDRALMFGLCHELCSEDGYGWNRRLLFFANWELGLRQAGTPEGMEMLRHMRGKYDPGTPVERSRRRVIEVLRLLSTRLQQQHAAGSRYYIGTALTALDIYAACFAAMVQPLPPEQCPLSPEMRMGYTEHDPAILDAADPLFLAHRDHIYATHLKLPLQF